ncbi:MAG: general secretion pathway protein GspK, partial [Sphingomonadaceae bacterium]|nr:general secretion pathway protein GspK [Sphingomonadaceae bacterium]
MILVNVLAVVAVATALVAAMLDTGAAIDRAAAWRDAARARAIARGGELSAIAALRRDTDPARDDRSEAWARVAQAPTPIAGGRFALTIDDAQGRFNVNA